MINNYIFTGAPGSGKTSVIDELETRGYNIIHESATDLIAQEQSIFIKYPWKEPGFTDKIIYMQKERQINSKGSINFYDRSPFCTYALDKYLSKTEKSTPSPIMLDEINRCLNEHIYNDKIFFFENLRFIKNTEARKISYEEALIFEQVHLDVYNQFGFEIITVPLGTVAERCEFILKYIS